jgi:hypothetical protein
MRRAGVLFGGRSPSRAQVPDGAGRAAAPPALGTGGAAAGLTALGRGQHVPAVS